MAFWNVIYQPCQHARSLPHTLLLAAFEGRQRIAPCFDCHPGNVYDPGAFPAGQIAAEAIERLGGPVTEVADPFAGLPPRSPIEQALSVQVVDGWSLPTAPAPAPAVELAACGERLETFGKAEGIAEAQDLLAVVTAAATQDPRPPSRQLPGMSALGTPCDRKLAARMREGSSDHGPAWRPYVGTAVHAVLDIFLGSLGFGPDGEGIPKRWRHSLAVEAGGSKGIIDVLDTDTATLIDFKISGVTKLKETYRGKVLPVYQGQLDLYALGLTLAGHRVEHVAVLVLPLAGEVEDAAWYSRPASLERASDLLSRAWQVKGHVLDGQPLDSFDIAEDACDYCPLKRRGDCPGAGKAAELPRVPITWGG